MYLTNGENARVLTMIAGAGGVENGDLVAISGGKVVKATADAGANTSIGVALETKALDQNVAVEVVRDNIITATYTGVTKTSLTDADLGIVFDISDAKTLNLDDTLTGSYLVTGYDNNVKEVRFMVLATARYL